MKKKFIFGMILTALAIPVIALAFNINSVCTSMGDEIRPHPLYNNMYIQCFNGQGTEYWCDNGLIYDPTIVCCVPGDVNSGETEVCYETITSKKSSQVLFCGNCKYIENSTNISLSGEGVCPKGSK